MYLCTQIYILLYNTIEVMNVPASKAQQRAVNKYMANNYDRVNLTLQKGRKDEIKAHADKKGESLNGFINRAIDETVERDGDDNA